MGTFDPLPAPIPPRTAGGGVPASYLQCRTAPMLLYCHADVDCISSWSPWSTCTQTCNGGTRTRILTITTRPSGAGTRCPATKETETCNTQPCSMNPMHVHFCQHHICSAEPPQCCDIVTQMWTASAAGALGQPALKHAMEARELVYLPLPRILPGLEHGVRQPRKPKPAILSPAV